MITTVTGKNQITIPAQLIRALDIQPGTRIDWSIGADGVLIAQVLPQRGVLAREIAGMGRAWLAKGDDPVADLIQERVQEDVEEGLR
ncbi:MAG: AbrB/MazE/SpoVT family DNA-binding domain-containing protein [Caldilineaceae bacterium]|nr:AbrB/MazE/SpoVT family DNA-binding domain-containing protein [Caldilineaceae bacterium]